MNQEIKKELIGKLNEKLDENIKTLQTAITSAKESRDSNTKSSVGDKYETNRAMMHIEIEKNEAQLSQNLKLKQSLSEIDVNKTDDCVGFGSLIITDNGNYFISIGFGMLKLGGNKYFAISMSSPIGNAFIGKKVGNSINFRGKNIIINHLI